LLDAARLEELGIPTLTFVTQPFESAARTHARLLGMPELPLVVVPSDYLDRSDAAVEAKLASRIDEILTALVG
jgi:hypothetical protein